MDPPMRKADSGGSARKTPRPDRHRAVDPARRADQSLIETIRHLSSLSPHILAALEDRPADK